MKNALFLVLLFASYADAQPGFIVPVTKQMVDNEIKKDIRHDYIIIPKECVEIFFKKMLNHPGLKDDGENLLWQMRNYPDNEPVYVYPFVWIRIQGAMQEVLEWQEKQKDKIDP